jgi:hypothetical protein
MRPATSVARPATLAALTALVPLAACARAAGAQRAEAPAAAAPSCLDSLPESRLTRVAVFAAAELPDAVHPAVVAAADLLAQTVAERVHAMLGASPGQLPAAEPRLTWRDLDRELRVTAYRDGRLAWRVERDTGAAAPRSAAALLARALDTLRAAGDAPFFWPEGWARDSVAFRIALRQPMVTEDGTVVPLRLRQGQGTPAFTALVPSMVPVLPPERPPRLHYPEGARDASAIDSVLMQFFVDPDGRVDPATVRDVWPAGRPRLTGEPGRYYDQFVAAIRAMLREARFRPARVGGCPVRQLVRQPFDFQLRR